MWKQLGLAVKLIFNNEKITKEDVESFKGDVLQVSTDKPTNQWAEFVPRDTIRPIRVQYFYQKLTN